MEFSKGHLLRIAILKLKNKLAIYYILYLWTGYGYVVDYEKIPDLQAKIQCHFRMFCC